MLSRRRNEEVIIADRCRVKVVAIEGSQVRLGFTAPMDIEIRRAEVPDLKRRGQAGEQATENPSHEEVAAQALRLYDQAVASRAAMRERLEARIAELERERNEALAVCYAVGEWIDGRCTAEDLRKTYDEVFPGDIGQIVAAEERLAEVAT